MERTSWYNPKHLSGTLGAVGSGQRRNILEKIEETIVSFTSSWSGINSWGVYQDISGGASFDKVYKCDGYRRSPSADHGNRSFYVRLNENGGTLNLDVHGDWITGEQKGQYNTAGTASWTISDTAEVKYWMNANEYAFASILSSSTGWRYMYFGEYAQITHTNPNQKGVAFLTQPATAGSNVVLNLDRNVDDGFRVGGVYQIVNQTPHGAAKVPGIVSMVTCSAFGGTSMTVSNLPNNCVSGAVLGIYPVRPIRSHIGTGNQGWGGETFLIGIRANGITDFPWVLTAIAAPYVFSEITTQFSQKMDRMMNFAVPLIQDGATEQSYGYLYFVRVSEGTSNNVSNVTYLAFNGDYDQIYKCFSRYECNNFGSTYHTWLQAYPTSGSLGVL